MIPAGQVFRRLLPAIAWAVVILVITGIPGESIPDSDVLKIPGIDKLIHFIIFSVFGILTYRGLETLTTVKRGKYLVSGLSIALISIAAGVTYGALTEYIQYCCLPGRHGNYQDFMANCFGTVFGVFLMALNPAKK